MAEPANGGEYLAEVQAVRDGDLRDKMHTNIKNNVTGATIGLVAGAMYGAYRKHNIFLTGFIGLLLGGLASYLVMNNE
jgi:hypothetical protein